MPLAYIWVVASGMAGGISHSYIIQQRAYHLRTRPNTVLGQFQDSYHLAYFVCVARLAAPSPTQADYEYPTHISRVVYDINCESFFQHFPARVSLWLSGQPRYVQYLANRGV
jgi:hypothetical protein